MSVFDCYKRPALVAGAYATAGDAGGNAAHVALYKQLSEATGLLDGFELPLFANGTLLPSNVIQDDTVGEAELLAVLHGMATRRPVRHVLTCIPATMALLPTCSGMFGLASVDAEGRAAAVNLARQAHAAVARINTACGCAAVIAVELHTAPRALQPYTAEDAAAAAEALRLSLEEVRSWDWAGAALVVEHCDAAMATHAPAKGFLPLSSELATLAALTETTPAAAATHAPVGLTLNWARSVLETRTREAARSMLGVVAPTRLLLGFMFSGCSDAPGDEGYGAFRDSHMPFDAAAAGSWLTAAEMESLVPLFPPQLLYTGVKVSLQPPHASLDARVQVNFDMLAVILRAMQAVSGPGLI